jgi:hypothetical protein
MNWTFDFTPEGSPMKKSRFTESQIVAILKEGEAGVPVAQLTRNESLLPGWRNQRACIAADPRFVGCGGSIPPIDTLRAAGALPNAEGIVSKAQLRHIKYQGDSFRDASSKFWDSNGT